MEKRSLVKTSSSSPSASPPLLVTDVDRDHHLPFGERERRKKKSTGGMGEAAVRKIIPTLDGEGYKKFKKKTKFIHGI